MSKRLFGLEGCGIQNVFSMSGYTGHYLCLFYDSFCHMKNE